jgi:septal ring-binding cell division protein DamX
MRRDALRTLAMLCAVMGAAACTLMPQPDEEPEPLPVTQPDPSLAVIGTHLDMMGRLTQATPAEQAEIVRAARDAAELTPTTSNRLSYALALATPGHGQADPAAARQLLTELLARPETLLPAERALAWVCLRDAEQRLILQAENARLQSDAARVERERSASTNRRLQAEIEENTRLKKALAEAQAKLDEIKRIERSIVERSPSDNNRSP